MAGNLDAVVELQAVLSRLTEERARYEGVPEPMRELHEEHSQLEERIATLEAAIEDAERRRRAAEAEAADEQQKIEHYQQQISAVNTQREYGALLTEIDGAKNRKREHEDIALAAMEEQESAKSELDELRSRFEDVHQRYTGELEEWESEKPRLLQEIESLEQQAESLRATLPDQALRLFEQLYERHGGEPLARIDRVERAGSGPTMWRCSVCNYSVRPQVVVEIQNHGTLVPCDCGRQRLYYLADE